MIIIGEKINGSIPSMGRAIAAHDEAFIREIARKQAESEVDFIDVCASVGTGEAETLAWLIGLVQDVCDTPISVDSPNARACVEAMPLCKRPGMINSVSGEGDKLDVVFPAIAGTNWKVMALLCDDKGIPHTPEGRIRVLERILESAAAHGIVHDRIYIDPLVEMLCASETGATTTLNVIRYIRKNYPELHISGGISNISYQLPCRRLVNAAFAAAAVSAGMDAAVLDPLDRDLRGMVLAAEALRGEDEYCIEYISAYREGIFGPLSGD